MWGSTTVSKGIDYGGGITNINLTTGIRYGVIPMHEVTQAWCDGSTPDYGTPCCPDCGTELAEDASECPGCGAECDVSECYGDEPLSHTYDKEGYKAVGGSDGDIFVIESPYYTRAAFCSPCAPGACYLTDPDPDGERAYCFGHDWFDDGVAPYPVYEVTTGKEVAPNA